MTKVIGELAIVRPTVFGAVPRTLNKLFGTGVNIFVNDEFHIQYFSRKMLSYPVKRQNKRSSGRAWLCSWSKSEASSNCNGKEAWLLGSRHCH